MREAFSREPDLPNLLLCPAFAAWMTDGAEALRGVVSQAMAHGIPVPSLGASLAYFDGYRSERLPQNLIQAQRDLFGAHTYERVDREGAFHTVWP